MEKTVRHHCTSTYANCHYFEKLFNVAATRISHRRQSRVFVLRTLGCAASAWRPSCQGYIDSFFRIAQTESCETTDGWLSLIFGRFMIIMNIKRKEKKSMVWKRGKNLGSARWNWILKRRLFTSDLQIFFTRFTVLLIIASISYIAPKRQIQQILRSKCFMLKIIIEFEGAAFFPAVTKSRFHK